MKAATRKKLLAYAIPVDLAVVATGVGLVFRGIPPLVLLALFLAAVAVSAWKSGLVGALAAMVVSALLLFALFSGSVHGEQIGAFVAASILVSIPLSAWARRRRRIKAWAEAEARAEAQALAELPPEIAKFTPVMVMQRPPEEQPAAVIDKLHAVERDSQARAEGERIAGERFAAEKRKIEEDFARRREQLEHEIAERLDIRRVELQTAYERERAALKEKFDAARLELEAGRAELQRQLEEERRKPAVIEKHIDEDALAERLEHLRAELQQQYERELRPRLDAELAAQRKALERDSERELEKARHSADERVATLRAELVRITAEQAAASSQPATTRARQAAPAVQAGFFRRIFNRGSDPQLKVNRRVINGDNTAARRAAAAALAENSATRRANAARAGERKARVLFLESRRATADTAAPRLKQLGIEVVIVERLVDAVDELHRFHPDVAFLDADAPDFEKAYKTISGHARTLPLVLTSRNASSIPDIGRAGIVIRPYAVDEVVDLARAAVNDPQHLLAKQSQTRPEAQKPPPPPLPKAPALPSPDNAAKPQPTDNRERALRSADDNRQRAKRSHADDGYDVVCANCRVVFDAMEADWCSCLTRERTVVCTNCLTCFCKAAPAYKEEFWLEAPPRLFERKTAELRRQALAIAPNPSPGEVKRPLVMLVEEDEDIQAMMQRVCANLGYGSVSARNGQDGLALAHRYHPNLILADAFLPGLDGREMCRLLREEPAFAGTKMVVLTGLYADLQYQDEALKRFRIDGYLVRPVSITDLINLLQRHLEGAMFLPAQENLHELHRKEIDGERPHGPSTYEVACAKCGDMFDAVKAEWCSCAGGDNTFVCEHCGNCFCDAPEYRKRFWAGAPAVLFERKMAGSLRSGARAFTPPPAGVKQSLVLLVEEDDAVQFLVKTVVSTLGYGFIPAANDQEALALARQYQPDLVLVDAWMPNVDGRDVCRQLKGDPALPRIKAIVMTGRYSESAYRREAMSHFRADDCIAKPLAVDDLLRMLKEQLPQEVQAI